MLEVLPSIRKSPPNSRVDTFLLAKTGFANIVYDCSNGNMLR